MRAPVNSFEFHRCRRTPQVEYLMLSLESPMPQTARITSIHRLPRGLPGYLILFDTHAFVPQRQWGCSDAAFAIGVLRDIYAFHRYTTHSASVAPTQAPQYQRRPRVEPADLTADLERRLRTL